MIDWWEDDAIRLSHIEDEKNATVVDDISIHCDGLVKRLKGFDVDVLNFCNENPYMMSFSANLKIWKCKENDGVS